MKLTRWIGRGLAIYGVYSLLQQSEKIDVDELRFRLKKRVVQAIEWALYTDDEQKRARRPKRKSYLAFYFQNQAASVAFLNRLNEHILQSGQVSVLIAKMTYGCDAGPIDYADNDYGWTDISNAYGRTATDGRYKLYLPKAKKLQKGE